MYFTCMWFFVVVRIGGCGSVWLESGYQALMEEMMMKTEEQVSVAGERPSLISLAQEGLDLFKQAERFLGGEGWEQSHHSEEDAYQQVLLARMGSMVNSSDAYLLKLRSEAYRWIEEIDGELASRMKAL